MKTLKLISRIILLIVVCNMIISKVHKSKKHKKHRYTPKAYELRNHFGAPTVGSPYGPNTSYEEYVEANPEVFTPQIYGDRNKAIHKMLEFHPYPGHENRLNPHFIKAGEMTNIAPSASTIISPGIANPKLHVQAQVNYPAHVKIPNFYGYKKELHPVTAYDTQDGRIIHEKVVLTKPVYGFEDSVQNIHRNVDQYYDLNSGERINMEKKTELHGIERESPKEHGVEHRRHHGVRR